MRKLLGLILVTGVLTGAVLAIASPPAGACSCASNPLAEADRFDAVFVGRVVGTPESIDVDLDHGPPEAQLVLEVSDVYAGSVAARQTVVVPVGGASCGLDLSQPGDLLVLGSRQDMGHWLPKGIYATNLCSSSWLDVPSDLQAVPPDLSSLGEPHPPVQGASPTIPRSTSHLPEGPIEWGLLVGGTLVALVLVGGAAWLVRRRHRAATT